MENAQLCFDAMLHVMSFSACKSIISLMETCHALYLAGARYLLEPGVALSCNNIILFASFMFAHEHTRFPYLREVTIDCDEDEDEDFDHTSDTHPAILAWIRLFTHPALAMKTLILQGADELLRNEPIGRALTAMTTLRHVTIHSTSPRTRAVVRSIASPLTSLTCCHPAPLDPVEASGPGAPVTLLTPFAASLQVVYCDFHGEDVERLRHIQPFPRVRRLGIAVEPPDADFDGLIRGGPISPAAYAHAFPNLDTLELVPNHSSSPQWQYLFHSVSAEVRRVNQEDQRQHGMWRALSACAGEVGSLYALGLVCGVASLRIWKDLRTVEEDFETVLLDMRPEHLQLGVDFSGLEALLALLRDPRFAFVQAVSVDVVGKRRADSDSDESDSSVEGDSGQDGTEPGESKEAEEECSEVGEDGRWMSAAESEVAFYAVRSRSHCGSC